MLSLYQKAEKGSIENEQHRIDHNLVTERTIYGSIEGSRKDGLRMDGQSEIWEAEAWRCAGCGVDCLPSFDDDGDGQGLCPDCRAECETGERCWVCAGNPCLCQALDYGGNDEQR
jgi:hypothetical protein